MIHAVKGDRMIIRRTLGVEGPSVGAVGYGAMFLEGYYGAPDDNQLLPG